MPTIRSKSQNFANVVFPNVKQSTEADWAAKYKTLCKKSGSLVRNSGLMQTLAFFKAKARKETEIHHDYLYRHLEQELWELGILPQEENLFEYVKNSDVPVYMYITREILHLLNWHKRLADTLIQGEEQPND